jgi:DnaJ-class molecular chaperone
MNWIKQIFNGSEENNNYLKFEKVKTTCYKCGGIGLIIRKTPFNCKHCKDNEKIQNCYLCENIPRGKYIECDKCYGDGFIIINNKYINEKSDSS